MLKNRRRLALGLQVAMTLFAHAKGAANAGSAKPITPVKPNIPEQTGRHDFTKLFADSLNPETLRVANERRRDAVAMADITWKLALRSAEETSQKSLWPNPATAQGARVVQPLTHEEARLWLQSFNAGPYALLKYQGNVPYQETQNYAPRVMKYYLQDLKNTPYEAYILASAQKYGLDPQMIRAIMKTESDFNNKTVSHAGARGLMQVMPVVWQEIKSKYELDWDYATGVFEPQKNIEVACAYLAWLRYDFLPRHFAEFDPNPNAPTILVRDRDRGVPNRPTPRIIASADPAVAKVVKPVRAEVVSPAVSISPVVPVASRLTAPATRVASVVRPAAKPVIQISDAQPKFGKLADGKTVTVEKVGAKTVVSVRGSQVGMKKPAVAGNSPDKTVVVEQAKPNHRSLKKPSVAKTAANDKEIRT